MSLAAVVSDLAPAAPPETRRTNETYSTLVLELTHLLNRSVFHRVLQVARKPIVAHRFTLSSFTKQKQHLFSLSPDDSTFDISTETTTFL